MPKKTPAWSTETAMKMILTVQKNPVRVKSFVRRVARVLAMLARLRQIAAIRARLAIVATTPDVIAG
jgi:hypothetical protein